MVGFTTSWSMQVGLRKPRGEICQYCGVGGTGGPGLRVWVECRTYGEESGFDFAGRMCLLFPHAEPLPIEPEIKTNKRT